MSIGFNSDVPVTKGELCFSLSNLKPEEVYKVGQDRTHAFGKTIYLLDGNPLKVSADDLFFKFQLITEDGKNKEEVWFPSSLFVQARKADKIFFSQHNRNFELTISRSSELDKYSFDQRLRALSVQAHTNLSMYIAEDVPEGYTIWRRQAHSITHIINHAELSPNARRVELGKRGTVPLNFSELHTIGPQVNMFKDLSSDECDTIITIGRRPWRMVTRLPNGRCKRELGFVYFVEKMKIDVIFDCNRLFVHIWMENPSKLDNKYEQFCCIKFRESKVYQDDILATQNKDDLTILLDPEEGSYQ